MTARIQITVSHNATGQNVTATNVVNLETGETTQQTHEAKVTAFVDAIFAVVSQPKTST